MSAILPETIAAIVAAGFDIYQRDESDSYAYFTDGEHIGYIENSRHDGLKLNTVHKPNQTTGTGFGVGSHLPSKPSREQLQQAFAHAPHWAFDRHSVEKFKSWDHFHQNDPWHASFKLIAKGNR